MRTGKQRVLSLILVVVFLIGAVAIPAAASGTKWAIVECETRRNTFADVEASAAYLKSI